MGLFNKLFGQKEDRLIIEKDKKDPRITHIYSTGDNSIEGIAAALQRKKEEEEELRKESDMLYKIFDSDLNRFFESIVELGKKGDFYTLNRYLDTSMLICFKVYQQNNIPGGDDQIKFAKYMYLQDQNHKELQSEGFPSIMRIIPMVQNFQNDNRLKNALMFYTFYQDNRHTGVFDKKF